MAGLAAAARARELGGRVVVYEKGDRAGGSMLLSSGVVWRYRTLAEFRRQCPRGDERLQAVVSERLDEALTWLESLGARVVARETGNPLTAGWRFDTRSLTEALVRAAGDVRLDTPVPADVEAPLVLATGGFQGDESLVRQYIAPAGPLPLRANRWSAGDGLRLALAHGAARSNGMSEFYGRAMPAPPARFTEQTFVPLAQVYGRFALVLDESGDEIVDDELAWHEVDLVQEIARRPGATAWFLVEEETLAVSVGSRTVADAIDELRRAGGTVVLAQELPFDLPDVYHYAVHVQASITHTVGGIRIDEYGRALDEDGRPVPGLFAAGVDAGGISAGGYASGLAAAVVFGRIAAESALGM